MGKKVIVHFILNLPHNNNNKKPMCISFYFYKREMKLKTLRVEKKMYLAAMKVIITEFA